MYSLNDPRLWELWYIPYYGLWAMQDLYHQPYLLSVPIMVSLYESLKRSVLEGPGT